MHVALHSHWAQRVNLLFHLEHVQCGDTKDLGLTALEDCRTVHAWNYRDFCVNLANVTLATAVDAHALF